MSMIMPEPDVKASPGALDEQSARFLEQVFGSTLPEDSAIEIRVKDADGKVRREWLRSPATRIDQHPQTAHVWFGVSLRRVGTTSGTLNDLTSCQVAWCDFDKLTEATKAEKIRELLRFPHPPTIIVDSGGGLHAYWKFTQRLDMRNPTQQAYLREVCHGLAQTLGADPNVHDPSRMLRVPGTYNPGNGRDKVYSPPRRATIVRLSEDEWDPATLARYRKPVAQSTGDRLSELPTAAAGASVTLKVNEKWQALIRRGWSEDSGYPSRSELDEAIMIAMLSAGHTDEEIFATFLDPTNAIGDKAREKGRGGSPYLRRTLDAAKTWMATRAESQAPIIKLDDGKMKAYRPRRKEWVAVYNKPIIPLARLRGAKEAWLVEVPGEKQVVLDSTSLSSAHHLKRALPPAGAWTGSHGDVQGLIPYFEGQNVPEQTSVDIIGMHGDHVVFPNAVLGPSGAVETNPSLLYTGSYQAAALTLREDWETLARSVGRLLLELHAPGAIHAVAGWFLATFIAPQVRELTGKGFPLLNVWGGTGSGKTTLLTLLWRLTGSTREPISIQGGTDFSRTMNLSSTNTLPMIFDEHRTGFGGLARFYSTVREAYQGEEHERGRADLTVMRRALTSPIVIAGESALPEPALRQRALIVKLAHDSLGNLEPPSPVRRAKARFEALPLLDFNGGFYRHVKGKDIPSLWREEADRARRTMTLPSDERKGFGPVAALLGLRLFEEFLTATPPDDMAKTLASSLDDGEEPSLVGLLVVTVFKLIQARVLRNGQDFVTATSGPEGGYLYLHPPLVFNKLASHFQKEHSDMPTSEDALREALRIEHQQHDGQGIVKSMREGKRFGETSSKAIVLNLHKVEESVGIAVRQWEAAFSGGMG